MTLRQALTRAREMLSVLKDVENPALESEVLLRHTLQIDRVRLLLEQDAELEPDKAEIFWQWIHRRLQGEPTAYIIRCREFYGLDFYVDNRVLIPRPETELLVEEAVKFTGTHSVTTIADIGAGSGAVAVSLAVSLSFPSPPEIPGRKDKAIQYPDSFSQIRIYATDISASALEVTRINCRKHGVAERVILLRGDLLEPLPEPLDILIANLPYVSESDMAGMPSAKFEPEPALNGGKSGLEKISRFCNQLKDKVKPGGCVLLEVGMAQSRAVIAQLHNLFPSADISVLKDLAGIERVVKMDCPVT